MQEAKLAAVTGSQFAAEYTNTMSGTTNGEQPIKALAAHKKGHTLEPFEYKPEPLGADDIGALSRGHCSTWHGMFDLTGTCCSVV